MTVRRATELAGHTQKNRWPMDEETVIDHQAQEDDHLIDGSGRVRGLRAGKKYG